VKKQTKETKETKDKSPVGRPSLYSPDYAEQAFKLCLLGATDKELADFFNVVESTLNLWKIEHPEFSESLKRGKIEADANVAYSLYRKANGFHVDAVKIFNDQGSPLIVDYKEYYPPDTAAINIWLKNRRGRIDPNTGQRWADKQEIGITDKDGQDVITVFELPSNGRNKSN
jgi:hypothetical protein